MSPIWLNSVFYPWNMENLQIYIFLLALLTYNLTNALEWKKVMIQGE